MKIVTLVENIAAAPLQAVHGLSLYIETKQHKILFDLGIHGAIVPNAETLGVDLTAVDTVIISHGHHDHGGDLGLFLSINKTAKVYIQQTAFETFYVNAPKISVKRSVSLDASLKDHPQIILVDGDLIIDDELQLFRADNVTHLRSTANDTLYCDDVLDRFTHEHNLVIQEGDNSVLFIGCGHSGVVNILNKATQWNPQLCIGGYHLYNPTMQETVSDELLNQITQEMAQHPIHFYTCHCTGEYAYNYLSTRLPQMDYLSCGTIITL